MAVARTHCLRAPDGDEWYVEQISSPDRRHIRVVHGSSAGPREVPMKLDLRSRILFGWLGTWPPESASELLLRNGQLCLAYRDEWMPFERPILPFGWDRESEWLARYDSVRGVWRLHRVRKLEPVELGR